LCEFACRDPEMTARRSGFLRDGTMVVVEDAAENVGHEVGAQVTSALQTNNRQDDLRQARKG